MMQFIKYFDIKRFWLIIKKDLFMLYSSVGVTIGAVAGVLVMYNVITLTATSTSDFSGLYKFLLVGGGLVVTSLSFSDMHKKEGVHNWLMLPSSNFEKLASRLLLVSIGYVILTITVVFTISFISALLYKIFFNISYPISNYVFNPFSLQTWAVVPHFLVLQSIFFLGAVYFKKMHFVKTVLSLTLFAFGLLIILSIIVKMMFWDLTNVSISLATMDINQMFPWMEYKSAGMIVKTILEIFYWIFIAPACWIISYFRIRETEVHHGI